MGKINYNKLISQPFLTALVILISVVYPRLIAIGYFPDMDDGIYSYWGRVIYENLAAGRGLPDWGGLSLYALLTSWAFALPGLPILWLRFADLIAAVWAAWLLCRVLSNESGNYKTGLLIALIFMMGMNHFEVVNAGFKQPFFFAYVPLFGAVRLAQTKDGNKTTWLIIGALTALAVLIRETLFPFALLGFLAAWIGFGRGACIRYCLGGIICACAIVGAIAINRGGVEGIWQYYHLLAKIYQNEAWRWHDLFTMWGWRALCLYKGQIWLCILCIGMAIIYFPFLHKKKPLFWLCAGLLPLAETCAKMVFLYHFAVCLPGLACFCACIWKRAALRRGGFTAAIIILSFFVVWHNFPDQNRFPVTLEVLKSLREWPENLVNESNTLMAAKVVNDFLPNGGSVATSGHTFFLYEALKGQPPLTGPFDPDDIFHLSDLSRAYITSGFNEKRLLEELMANPPDALILAFTKANHESTFIHVLRSIVKKSGLYEFAAIIPLDFSRNYGWMGYEIYRRSKN